ncbi:uncharacterized protein Hap1MRO34_026036 isoform 2-T2 [Clarias gariepinus]
MLCRFSRTQRLRTGMQEPRARAQDGRQAALRRGKHAHGFLHPHAALQIFSSNERSQDLRECLRKPSAPSPLRKRHGHDFGEVWLAVTLLVRRPDFAGCHGTIRHDAEDIAEHTVP